jgi:ubiquinone/menaquinone biosynthesis C-methylase UbiE
MSQRPICDYENSDYQRTFWDAGTRVYEDLCEQRAIARLMPQFSSGRLLELGAGAGRNTLRYGEFDKLVLLDYSRTQLQQARSRLGASNRFVYVAADAYNIPFVDGWFDAATMIRTLHHLSDPAAALREARRVLKTKSVFLLEFANKRNLKAILRFLVRRQKWSPFTPEPTEYLPLNFDFHPASIRRWLSESGFRIRRQATVSHFRVGFIKRTVPARWLSAADYLAGYTGDWFQLSPSVFVLAEGDDRPSREVAGMFRCPHCGNSELTESTSPTGTCLICEKCRLKYPVQDGIYNFKEPFSL